MKFLLTFLLLLTVEEIRDVPVILSTVSEEAVLPTYTEADSLYDLAITLLKKMEGLRLSPYVCPGGQLTIGYGHTKTASQHREISLAMADSLLRMDYDRSLVKTDKINPDLSPSQRTAVAMFIFNLGSYKLKGTRTLTFIQNGYEPPFHLWVYAKGKKLRGLEKRRQIESEIWQDWRAVFQKTSVHLTQI